LNPVSDFMSFGMFCWTRICRCSMTLLTDAIIREVWVAEELKFVGVPGRPAG
jgi:hypothetical protein